MRVCVCVCVMCKEVKENGWMDSSRFRVCLFFSVFFFFFFESPIVVTRTYTHNLVYGCPRIKMEKPIIAFFFLFFFFLFLFFFCLEVAKKTTQRFFFVVLGEFGKQESIFSARDFQLSFMVLMSVVCIGRGKTEARMYVSLA